MPRGLSTAESPDREPSGPLCLPADHQAAARIQGAEDRAAARGPGREVGDDSRDLIRGGRREHAVKPGVVVGQ